MYRCTLKTKAEESTRLVYTGSYDSEKLPQGRFGCEKRPGDACIGSFFGSGSETQPAKVCCLLL